MFQIERQEQILEYINQTQKANTAELAAKFNVSKVTIRRDIEALAASGLIVKTHGGAIVLFMKYLTLTKQSVISLQKKASA